MAEQVKLTRKALYHAIWRLPATRVAGKLGISYQKIKKACEETNIPQPPSDYHLKRAKGIKMPIPPLPPYETEILEFTKIIHREKKPSDYSNRHIPLCLLRILESWSDENTCISMGEITRLMDERYNLKVTRSTIYKAVATLQDMGFKVYGFDDNNGLGYSYERPLKPAYIKLIIESLSLNPLISEEKMQTICRELNKLMSHYNALFNRRLIQNDTIKQLRSNPYFYMALEAIDMALVQHRKIEFDYYKPDTNGTLIPAENGHYTLIPCKIYISGNHYYLRCFTADRHRTILFRIEQMRNVTISEEECENLPGFFDHSQEAYADEYLNAYNNVTTVSLRCDNSLAGQIADLFSSSFSEPRFSADAHKKKFTVTGRIPYQKALEWAMAHVDKALVLEPQQLYDEICTKLKNNLYNQ